MLQFVAFESKCCRCILSSYLHLIALQSVVASLPVVTSAEKPSFLPLSSSASAAEDGIDLAVSQHSDIGHLGALAWTSPPVSRGSLERSGVNKSPLKLVRQVRIDDIIIDKAGVMMSLQSVQ